MPHRSRRAPRRPSRTRSPLLRKATAKFGKGTSASDIAKAVKAQGSGKKPPSRPRGGSSALRRRRNARRLIRRRRR